MPTAYLTKTTVDDAGPGKSDYFLWDGDHNQSVAGFGLKVSPAGGKVYVFQYRMTRPGMTKQMPTRRITLGAHGKLTPDQARKDAKRLAADVVKGIDPYQIKLDSIAAETEAKRQAKEKAKLEGELVFEKVAARWLEHYESETKQKGGKRKPRTVEQARAIVKTKLEPALRGKPLPHITRADLQAIIDAIPLKHRASRLAVYAYASVLFQWAMARGEIADSPVRQLAKPGGPESRDRVLNDDELATVWVAAEGLRASYRAFYKLLILTGQRREEVAGMTWAELERSTATWTIPAIRAKNGVVQLVHLAPAVLDELDRLALAVQVKAQINDQDAKRWPKAGPVLTSDGKKAIKSYSQAKAELDAAIIEARGNDGPLPAWRVHDLRRTLATGLQKLGTRFEVTEAVLNHVSGARSGVAGIYQRHDWRNEKRAALEAWACHVAELADPAENTNVVPLATAQKSA